MSNNSAEVRKYTPPKKTMTEITKSLLKGFVDTSIKGTFTVGLIAGGLAVAAFASAVNPLMPVVATAMITVGAAFSCAMLGQGNDNSFVSSLYALMGLVVGGAGGLFASIPANAYLPRLAETYLPQLILG